MRMVSANVVIVSDYRVQEALALLRNRNLPLKEFREASDIIAWIMSSLVVNIHQKSEGIILAPILRAGLAFEYQFMHQFQFRDASVHHIGVERDEETCIPKSYYPRRGCRSIPPNFWTIVLDPMNATGGSGSFAMNELRKAGATNMTFVNVISSLEGIERINTEFPDVDIYTCAVDPELDSKKFIVPGLGDYGDRYFGT